MKVYVVGRYLDGEGGLSTTIGVYADEFEAIGALFGGDGRFFEEAEYHPRKRRSRKPEGNDRSPPQAVTCHAFAKDDLTKPRKPL